MKNIAAILLDLGDTIMDEGTEVKDTGETTLSADLIPGMGDALHSLHAQGYRLAIVADARPNTPINVLKQHGLLELFESLSVSEVVGAEKPDAHIFLHALEALHISEEDYPHVIMVGNNLERDIVGANRLGIRSVYFHVNDRRRSIPLNRLEAPRHTVTSAQEFLDLVAALEVEVTADQPPRAPVKPEERELVARFTPLIRFDESEPFLPSVVGYTILKNEDSSPSFFRRIQHDWRPAWTTAIEYAIWWDWDIGHLYELEHVWTYLDEFDHLVWAEASSHGGYASMICENGAIPCDGTHPIVYSQPGKHAFSPTPHWFTMFRDLVCQAASVYAGAEGVLVKEQYTRQIPKTREIDIWVGNWLRRKAFTPTLKFNQQFQINPDQLVPWPVLDTWIPARVNWWIDQLRT